MASPSSQSRVPRGLVATRAFPVVHVGAVPPFDPRSWDLNIRGLVEQSLRITWEEFSSYPHVVRKSDFHCVLGFSRLDNYFEGVLAADLIERAGPHPAARFVRFSDGRDYDTTIPTALLAAAGVLFADAHDGRPLAPEHGGPLRVVVPDRYAWKSCKWVRDVELIEKDKAGYWESRGYSHDADITKLPRA